MSSFLANVAAKGAGCLTFGLLAGEPVLLGLQMGAQGRGMRGRDKLLIVILLHTLEA